MSDRFFRAESLEPETVLTKEDKEYIRQYLGGLAISIFGDDFNSALTPTDSTYIVVPTPIKATKTLESEELMLDFEVSVEQVPETLGVEFKNHTLTISDRVPYVGPGNFKEVLDGQKIYFKGGVLNYQREICLYNEDIALMAEMDYAARTKFMPQDEIKYYDRRSKKGPNLEDLIPVLTLERFEDIRDKVTQVLEYQENIEIDDGDEDY